MLHYWKQEFKATDSTKNKCQVEGKGTVAACAAQYWFKKFGEVVTSPENREDLGLKLVVDSGVILNTVETNSFASTLRLSNKLGNSQTSVIRISLHANGMVNKCCCREVPPHELTENQALNCVKTSKTVAKSA